MADRVPGVMRILATAAFGAAAALVLLVLAVGAAVLAVLVALTAVLGLVADLVVSAVLAWERARSPRPQAAAGQDGRATVSPAASLLEAHRTPAEAPKVFH
jgi:hypothetical protein